MKEAVSTINAPEAIGPYSQGIVAAGLIFTSGQLPVVAATGEMPDDIEAQTRTCLDNLEAVLRARGASLADAVKVSVFLNDIADFARVNAIYAERFPEPFPARSAYAVAKLPKGALVEIEAIAVLPG